ncbi:MULTISPECIES: hypothetical protein [Enterobacter]|uniref:hypothetical protein n=1 Tax=Enterobacter TaxID=547 RepID=UPI0012E73A57|nr:MULTISPECIES: hypothetical protein [Enterobacter]EKS6337394.1 hypothetical protein [Enterobacter hormaechei]
MNKHTVYILLTILSGFGITTVNATDAPSQITSPVVAREPGPVINPENSQYTEREKPAKKN